MRDKSTILSFGKHTKATIYEAISCCLVSKSFRRADLWLYATALLVGS